MYNPYQGQPQNNGYQTGAGYYQQPQQPQQQQQSQQPQQPQQQMQSSYGTMQQQSQQPNYGMSMQQPQQNVGLQANQLGGIQNYQQPQVAQQPQVTQPLQQQSTGYYANMQNYQQPQVSQPPLQQQTTGYYPTLSPSQPQLQPQGTNSMQPQGTNSLQPQVTNPMQTQQITQPQMTNQLQVPQQPLLPQQTGFYVQQSQVPLEPLKPTATGFVNSFANNGVNNDVKIPAMRLSFITANDQAKFETLFRSVIKPGSNTINGTDCRAILLKSGLPPSQLAKIWALCDTSKAGELLFPEFALAMHLINNVLQGDSIPYELETKTKNEVNSFIDAINLSIGSSDNNSKTPFDEMLTAGISNLQPQPTGLMPSTSFGMPAQVTGGGMINQMTGGQMMPQTSFGMPAQVTGGGMINQMTGGGMINQMTGGQMMPQTSFGMPPQLTGGAIQPQITGGYQPQLNQTQTGNMMMPQLSFGQQQQNSMQQPAQQQMLQAQATGYLPPSNFNPTMPLMAQKTGFGNNEIYSQTNFANKMTSIDSTDNDKITPDEKSIFYNIFQTYDTQGKGLIDSATAVEIFRKSGLNRADLEHIWNLCDINNSGQLNKQEFALGMHLVYRKLNGNPLPNRLPPSLIPSSNQILDNVKNQLKNADNSIVSQSKINALNFKNNDEEDVLPTFRNRRKIFSTTTEEKKSSPQVEKQEISTSTESVESKYPPIDDIPAENTRAQQTTSRVSPEHIQAKPVAAQSTSSLSEELKSIEKLQTEIKNIIPPSLNSTVSSDLLSRFETIFTKIPTLFAEINEVEQEITDARINLFKLKNPSSIIGTGANGEITENDRKKAKSRSLLRSRMAALTGKQSLSTEEDESAKFNEEITKIKKESDANQEVIGDVKTSISDISASLKSFLIGKALDNESGAFEKWEFGIDLEPETQKLIHQLNIMSFKNEPSKGGNPQSKTEDRAAQLKEQAQKRMKERLAKFGLDRRSGDRSSRSRRGTVSTDDDTTKQESPFIPDTSSAQSTGISTPVEHPAAPINSNPAQNESDSEDEEERKLKEELQKLKLKKKSEKEKRLAELRKQLANAQAEESDEETFPANSAPLVHNTNPVMDSTPTQQNSFIPPPPALPVAEDTVSSSPSQVMTPAINNAQPAATEKRNPFFKPQPASSSSTFDSKAAEVQRRIQRGINDNDEDDDDWSDDDNDVNNNFKTNASVTQSIPAQSYSATTVVPQAPNVGSVVTTLAPPPAPVMEDESRVSSTQTHSYSAPVPVATPPVPVAPPVPSVTDTYTPPVPVAPPVPSVTDTYTPPVPVAPPVPSVTDTYTPPVPVAPPVPSVTDTYTPPVPVAPPVPSVTDTYTPPVSVAPPVPSVTDTYTPLVPAAPSVANSTQQAPSHTLPPPPTLPANILAMDEPENNGEDNDDVLSIPESVDSETGAEHVEASDYAMGPPAGIPPPPPLPNM
ncbi:actin cytoskeleton-regulatory complex protein Pan1p [Monosporozyma servazzii]